MHLIRQSTASTVTVGPVLDSTGAAVTSAVVGDFRISKNGTTATLSGATVTHDANGYYNIALTTGNTDTAGRLVLFSGNTAQSMGAHRFTVLLPSVFDALIANATNSTGGLATATAAISAFAGAISTLTAGGVRTELATELSRIDQTIGSRSTQTSVDLLSSYVDTEVAAIKAKTDLITAFPSNFAALSINASGHISRVTLVDTTTTNTDMRGTDGAALATNWTATRAGYLDGVLIAANYNQRTVSVTGSNHVASVLHDAEPNSIPEDAFVSGAISARVIATDAIDADALADGAITAGVFAADSITATALATSAGEEIADRVWDEAIAAHLASGSTGEALNNAGGSGNPWITDLSTGYTGTQAGNILNQVKAKTDLITSGAIQTSLPVTQSGQITGPLFIGDDYLQANGRAFSWTVALPSGFVIATSVCKFGMELAEGTGGASFNVTGTVVDAGGGNVTLRFDVPRATTGTLEPGFYRWSVEIASAGGNEVTRVASDGKKLVEWREKQT